MTESFDYGRKLTDSEYQYAIVSLYQERPDNYTREQDRQIHRKELDLAIDHRIGCDFPINRREKLWAIQESVDKHQVRLLAYWLVRRLFANLFLKKIHGMADFLVDEYAKVLSPEELAAFFGVEVGERPQLPIDPSQL
ncbi:MAG: hypothetical protein NTX45_10555 [Proteobacteria bacterium]|nr:hypothetical protein [Pseudomonadota bacterium]